MALKGAGLRDHPIGLSPIGPRGLQGPGEIRPELSDLRWLRRLGRAEEFLPDNSDSIRRTADLFGNGLIAVAGLVMPGDLIVSGLKGNIDHPALGPGCITGLRWFALCLRHGFGFLSFRV